MLKKIIILILIFYIFTIKISLVLADDEIEDFDIKGIEEAIEIVSEVTNDPKINSKYAVVIDRNSKAILYGKNEKIKTKMASTTKIMSSIIVIENANLNDIVEISSKAAGTGGSRLKISKGDKITVKDLLYGLMLRSGNDAAVALAEYVGGSIEGFAKLMNKKAEELGLENTNYVTPHGLDSEEHYTTAYELALLTNYALKNEIFANIVGTKICNITINGYSRTISNTNELLGYLNGVYGVKTGFTNGAGRCLVTAIRRGNLDVICIILGADTKKIRTTDSIKLIEYVFGNYENEEIRSKIQEEFNRWKEVNSGRIFIDKGIKNGIDLNLAEYDLERYPIKKNTENKLKIEMNVDSNLIAPVQKNSRVGELAVFYGNEIILKIDILAAEDIRKKNVTDYLLEIIQNFNYYLQEIIEY